MTVEQQKGGNPSMPHRIAYICNRRPLEFGAIGQYTLLNAREQAAAGHNVPRGGPSSTHDSTEYEDPRGGTVKIRRIHIETYDKANVGRCLWRELRQMEMLRLTGRGNLAVDRLTSSILQSVIRGNDGQGGELDAFAPYLPFRWFRKV
jgi:hypothetical protein